MKNNVRIAFIFFGLALLTLLTLCPLKGAENLYDSVIRLHVVANSDSTEDQTLKLTVRDSILHYAKENFDLKKDVIAAKEEMEHHLEKIESLAKETLQKEGVDQSVSVRLTKEYYPTRRYESVSLPAGDYLSLQVKIGEAKGQNWWCMVFPPMCLESALESEEALAFAGMEEENIKTVVSHKNGYKIRFKVLSLWSETKEKLKELFWE